jgi:hypothetical protein
MGSITAQHAPIALQAGLDTDAVGAVRVGKPPNLTKSDEAAGAKSAEYPFRSGIA